MYNLLVVLSIITCILLILLVLVQNSKGGGLASNFQSGNQFGGVVQTNKFLERGTWILAGALLVFCLAASLSIPRGEQSRESAIKEQIQGSVDYNIAPNIPGNVENNTNTGTNTNTGKETENK